MLLCASEMSDLFCLLHQETEKIYPKVSFLVIFNQFLFYLFPII